MNSSPSPRILYVSFDQVPSPKGASTHIQAFVKQLGKRYGTVILVTPGPEDVDAHPFALGVRQIVLGCPDDNPIGRARTFRVKLVQLLDRQPFELIHFRSIFEGYPLIRPEVRRGARLIYEANGFPSIEMKYHYRNLIGEQALTEKLVRQEVACLGAVDRIVTVSEVSKDFIIQRGISANKITLIRNGVDPAVFPCGAGPPREDGPLRVVYTGTMTAWQGIETLLEAIELVRREYPAHLKLIGATLKRRRQELEKVIEHLKIRDGVQFLPPSDQGTVADLLRRSHVAVVPLLAVDRNTRQGCCPLKLLEAMFSGCPVIASDLAVVRELAQPETHYLPARPGDARNLKNVILRLARDHQLRQRLSQEAYEHVAARYTWKQATERLLKLYESLLCKPLKTCDSRSRSTSQP